MKRLHRVLLFLKTSTKAVQFLLQLERLRMLRYISFLKIASTGLTSYFFFALIGEENNDLISSFFS